MAPISDPWMRGGQRMIPAWGCCRRMASWARITKWRTFLVTRAPTHSRCVGELFLVRKLNVPRLEGTDRVKSPLTKPLGNLRGEILVQVELHALRTKPGSLAWMASRLSTAFSAISASISRGYLL